MSEIATASTATPKYGLVVSIGHPEILDGNQVFRFHIEWFDSEGKKHDAVDAQVWQLEVVEGALKQMKLVRKGLRYLLVKGLMERQAIIRKAQSKLDPAKVINEAAAAARAIEDKKES